MKVMKDYGQDFWENCWKQNTLEEYSGYLSKYHRRQNPVIDLLKRHNVHYVCDAACGYGAYSLMLASNGFQVEGFDISPTSVEVTKELLKRYGIDSSNYKVASVLNTGYEEIFNAVVACSVLDHLYEEDAKKALDELLRIVKKDGIVVVSFDGIDEDYVETAHEVTADGSFLYSEGKRSGMVFHYYSDEKLKRWLNLYPVIDSFANDDGERFFAIQKRGV